MTDTPDVSDEEMNSHDADLSAEPVVRSVSRRRNRPELQLRIAEYEGRSNRATIHPESIRDCELLETWLSVDVAVIEQLDAWR